MAAEGVDHPAPPPSETGRSAILMGTATAISRGFGFARVLVIAAVLGTTDLGNTFQSSNLVSNVLFELLAAGALSAVLVPSFVDLFRRGREDEAEELAGGLLGVGLLVTGIIAVAGVALAPAIARALTAGVDDPSMAAAQRDLATFLLVFFIPQVMLYAVGAVATAVLQAQRRFTVPAAAPIGNTVVIVAGMITFAVLRDGQAPALDLSSTEKLVLALAGTLGVAAFVGTPAIALRMRGFRLRPRLAHRNPLVTATVRHAAWAGFQNASVGILLASALIVGMGVAGGVVAYYVAYTFFLVPYAILGQSIHDTVLPELARYAGEGDLATFGRVLRSGLDAMALLVVPAAAAYIALGQPIMRVVAFGETTSQGASMMGSALGGLALGLFPYSAFLMLTRASYALGAVAYAGAALTLGVHLARRIGHSLIPRALIRSAPAAGVLGLVAWAGWRAVDPSGRPLQILVLATLGLLGAAAYAAVAHPPSVRRWRAGAGAAA
ncbi:MAG: hypothetical protein HYU28_02210 [Actinobacteria bacterium]|nr:hypothetical protein [Actinomycetota bacterium]